MQARVTERNDHAIRKQPDLPAAEWDFRAIPEDELMTALIFEFIRSSPIAQNALKSWHSQPIDRQTMNMFSTNRDPATNALRKAEEQPITRAATVEWVFNYPADVDIPEERKLVLRHLESNASLTLAGTADGPLAARFCNFEKPWTELRSAPDYRNNKTRLLPPAPRRKCFQEITGKNAWYTQALREIPTLRRHRVLIDWDVRIDEIQKAVAEWIKVTRQAVRMGQPRRGGNQPRAVLFKFLAAHRLLAAGYSFNECQEVVNARRSRTSELDSSMLVLPIYKSKGKWIDAAEKAERILHGNFAQLIRTNFGFPAYAW